MLGAGGLGKDDIGLAGSAGSLAGAGGLLKGDASGLEADGEDRGFGVMREGCAGEVRVGGLTGAVSLPSLGEALGLLEVLVVGDTWCSPGLAELVVAGSLFILADVSMLLLLLLSPLNASDEAGRSRILCVSICCFMLPRVVNPRSQTSHLYGRSLV